MLVTNKASWFLHGFNININLLTKRSLLQEAKLQGHVTFLFACLWIGPSVRNIPCWSIVPEQCRTSELSANPNHSHPSKIRPDNFAARSFGHGQTVRNFRKKTKNNVRISVPTKIRFMTLKDVNRILGTICLYLPSHIHTWHRIHWRIADSSQSARQTLYFIDASEYLSESRLIFFTMDP